MKSGAILSNHFEHVRATALRFVDEVIPSTLRVPNRVDVWKTLDSEDRGRAEEMRREIRKVTRELALAMEPSAVLTQTDVRDIGHVDKRVCAILRFEEYAGSIVDCGEPLKGYETRKILEPVFDAIKEWIDFSSQFSGVPRKNSCAI
jgi:hypothetical protein